MVDDHPLVREWLTTLINKQPDLLVCGEAGEAPQALQAITVTKPDLAVVDITLKSGSGIELIKNLKAVLPNLGILVLSMHDDTLYAERALRAGAKGYIMKSEMTDKVIAGIRRVLAGQLYVSEQAATRMAEKLVQGNAVAAESPIGLLSDRELEVFSLLGRGHETRRIAEELHVSQKTVQAHCARIKEKLRLDTPTELIREAVRWQESQQSK